MPSGAPLGDLHNHLIPGVDDGARTIDQSLEGIGRMLSAGVRMAVATPHLDASLTLDAVALNHRIQMVTDAWQGLAGVVEREHPEFTLARGFEIALDIPEPDLSNPDLRIAGTRAVLVEWPRMQIPPATPAAVSNLRDHGIRPIVAHPERYVGTRDRLTLATEWRKAGAYLQVNYGSLLGRYGARVRTMAFKLLRAGVVDLLATDFHGRPHLKLYIREAAERFRGLDAEEHFELLTSVNPFRVVEDQELLPVPMLPEDGRLWERIKDLFQSRSR